MVLVDNLGVILRSEERIRSRSGRRRGGGEFGESSFERGDEFWFEFGSTENVIGTTEREGDMGLMSQYEIAEWAGESESNSRDTNLV